MNVTDSTLEDVFLTLTGREVELKRSRATRSVYTGMQFRELWRDPLTAFFGLRVPIFFLLLTGFM